jgi:hypothetical protein
MCRIEQPRRIGRRPKRTVPRNHTKGIRVATSSLRSPAEWNRRGLQDRCMKAIIDTAGTVEYAVFLAAVIAASAA